MINKKSMRTLLQFKKEFQELLSRYAEVQVWPDRDGRINASLGIDRTRLPSRAEKVGK